MPLLRQTEARGRELRRRTGWILALGLAATVTPLVILVAVELNYVQGIERTAARVAVERAETIGMLERVRRGQTAVRRVVAILSAEQSFDPNEAERLILSYREEIDAAGKAARGSYLEDQWVNFEAVSDSFTRQALQLLHQPDTAPEETDALFQLQDDSMVAMRRLVDASHAEIQDEIALVARQSERLRAFTLYGIAICLVASAGAAIVTIRTLSEAVGRYQERSAELRRVSGLLIDRQETAARRFSHELHDELGQTLAALKAEISALHVRAELEQGRARAIALADDAIRSVRDVSHLLHPTVLENLGLRGALESLTEQFSQRTGIEVEFLSTLSGRLSDESKTHLYRISQEALTNIARHSGATKASIELSGDEDSAFLEIRDNGRGFANVSKSSGIGLKGMEARAAFAGGEFETTSDPGRGVTIRVKVPLEQ